MAGLRFDPRQSGYGGRAAQRNVFSESELLASVDSVPFLVFALLEQTWLSLLSSLQVLDSLAQP